VQHWMKLNRKWVCLEKQSKPVVFMSTIPNSQSNKEAINIAIEAAIVGGTVLKDYFGKNKKVTKKGKCNLVSNVDCLSERQIIDLLLKEYPGFNILAEESFNSAEVKDYTWIIDPLDGTNNYIYGVPFFCVTIALVFNKDILLGVTYDPIRDELFVAQKGKGTFLNGSLVAVSQHHELESAMIGLDLGYDIEQGSKMLDIIRMLWGNIHCIRMMGSSALGLAYVACGRITAYLHRSVYPWDIASGILLINEAGGVITDWESVPATYNSKKLIAANTKVSNDLKGILAH
jgi:myo-inositol-1(or 4)-monophosphatase